MAHSSYNVYEIRDAKEALARLVERAAAGEEVVIAKGGKPLAKLVPVAAPRARRQPGGWRGGVGMAPNFNAPLPPELQLAFECATDAEDAR